jgi:hypothetical protein
MASALVDLDEDPVTHTLDVVYQRDIGGQL